MFHKMYTGLNCPKPMEQLNGKIHYKVLIDVQKANLTDKKQRKHSKIQIRKMTRRLLDLQGNIMKEDI